MVLNPFGDDEQSFCCVVRTKETKFLTKEKFGLAARRSYLDSFFSIIKRPGPEAEGRGAKSVSRGISGVKIAQSPTHTGFDNSTQ